MQQILVIGAGKIGSLIAFLLAKSGDYQVHLADQQTNQSYLKKLSHLPAITLVNLYANDIAAISQYAKQHNIKAVISSLPFYYNIAVAQMAAENQLHYFDLTEDIQTTQTIKLLAQNSEQAFVPQCGLAPGFISIIANHLMQHFTSLDTVKLRVGALPINISNALQYSLTWSTDGLINEYGNICKAIKRGAMVELASLEGLEEIKIDGVTYEAFNTSGGIGSLAETYLGKTKNLNYKTIRYPGHCAKMKFLMNDLDLNNDRETLKHILEHAIPKSYQDVVIVYVSVTGILNEQFIEENYVEKFYPTTIDDHQWSAIQLTTASAICTIVDLVLHAPEKYHGFIKQEDFSFDDFTNNKFGRYFLNKVE